MLAALGTMGAGLGLGAIGGLFGSSAEKKQLALMKEAIAFQKQQWEDAQRYTKEAGKRGYADLQPYRQMGANQVGALNNMLANPATSNYTDPGFQFRFKSGTDAINNSAAAKGMQLSGDTLRALTDYGQNAASQEYGNAFNRWLGEGQFRQGVSQQGQNAAYQSGELGNQNAQLLVNGANNIGNTVGQMTSNAVPYAGSTDRMWGNYLGGLGGMAMGAAGSLMGGAGGMGGIGNALGGLFGKAKGSGMGTGAAANSWFG